MTFTNLVSFILLGCAAANVQALPPVQVRKSPISLRIATHINATGGTAVLIEADRARFAAMRARGPREGASPREARAQIPIPARDDFVTYTCDIPIGSPPTFYTLLVDTGSSNTWVGAAKNYVVTSTSNRTSDFVGVQYGSGQFGGREWTDRVWIGSAAIAAQSIGVASFTNGFSNVDGILGIGPADLTVGTLYPGVTTTIPTVTDNLKSQGFISSAEIGISFEPTTGTTAIPNGQLDFGGTDPSKYTGAISYVSITTVQPAARYWGITQGITYGSSPLLQPSSAGIVDTGTTLLYLPSDVFKQYASVTGGAPDGSTGLLRITPAQFAALQSMHFSIGGVAYEFTANAQIWPRHLNTLIGGVAEAVYLVAADSGTASGSGMDFINGLVWLQRFYTVFDTEQARIGFAATANTYASTN